MSAAGPGDRPQTGGQILLGWVIFSACLVYSLAVVRIGWDHTILDGDHGFRQTQTAISSYYMVKGGPSLAYETPVLGPPWSVPFEFPLYQWIVASIVSVLSMPLDQTGRFVSVSFFYLSLVPANQILALRHVAPANRLLILSLVLLSPFYLFWSRTFMIESLALFFSMCYFASALEYCEFPRTSTLMAAILCGVVAALEKVTTMAVVWVPVALILAADLHKRARETSEQQQVWRRILASATIAGAPLLAAACWTRFADSLKEQNPLARGMTSTALSDWNFGTLGQRLSAATWAGVLGRGDLIVGHLALVAVGFMGLVFAGSCRRDFWAAVGIFLAGPLLFTNLHLVHEYYAYANGIFLIAALGLSVGALLERGGPYRRAGFCIFAMAAMLSVFRYVHDYYPKQSHNSTELIEIAAIVRGRTSADEVVMILGCDWSSEIPYYSGRRAVTIPTQRVDLTRDAAACLSLIGDYRLGALVLNRTKSTGVPRTFAAELCQLAGLDEVPVAVIGGHELFCGSHSAVTPTTSSRAPHRASGDQRAYDNAR